MSVGRLPAREAQQYWQRPQGLTPVSTSSKLLPLRQEAVSSISCAQSSCRAAQIRAVEGAHVQSAGVGASQIGTAEQQAAPVGPSPCSWVVRETAGR